VQEVKEAKLKGFYLHPEFMGRQPKSGLKERFFSNDDVISAPSRC
jgi:hypothetical protein